MKQVCTLTKMHYAESMVGIASIQRAKLISKVRQTVIHDKARLTWWPPSARQVL